MKLLKYLLAFKLRNPVETPLFIFSFGANLYSSVKVSLMGAIFLFSAGIALAEESKPDTNCLKDSNRQLKRSKELQEIVTADQADREEGPNIPPERWPEISKRDLKRRKRVGEIFGEGCFKTSADYAAAALVFQHGDQPDHYFQTYIWSKRGVELGDKSQKRMMAFGADRFLVNTGQKQLFASQALRPDDTKCWCLQPVETSFPDEKRRDLNANTIFEALEWVDSMNAGTNCPKAAECNSDLAPTPQGSLPGLW